MAVRNQEEVRGNIFDLGGRGRIVGEKWIDQDMEAFGFHMKTGMAKPSQRVAICGILRTDVDPFRAANLLAPL